jgi:hypothetical protein
MLIMLVVSALAALVHTRALAKWTPVLPFTAVVQRTVPQPDGGKTELVIVRHDRLASVASSTATCRASCSAHSPTIAAASITTWFARRQVLSTSETAPL